MGVFSALFSFKGRLRRRWFVLITAPIILWSFFLRMGLSDGADPEAAAGAFLLTLPLLWPQLAAAWKRNHDQGRTGWWSLLLFVPLVGLIHYLLLAFGAGEYGTNAYGTDPTLRKRDGLVDASIFN